MRHKLSQLLAPCAFLLALAGCADVRPLYGTNGSTYSDSVSSQLADIEMPEPQSRIEQLIRNDLISSMSVAGAHGNGRFSLALQPHESSQSAFIDTRSEVGRRVYQLSVTYILTDKTTHQPIYQGKTFSNVSYDRITSEFANMQAKTNAQERAAGEVAQDIRTRLAAFFADYNGGPVAIN
ncbi:MAG: hypothetical protein ACR2OR_03155 [Hyphomicrobiales bacterium]